MSEHPESPMDSAVELLPLWRLPAPDGGEQTALDQPWAARHRPDWAARGLIAWPRGGQWLVLRLQLTCPRSWRALGPRQARARLALCWWAEAAEVWVTGRQVRQGDLFDSRCRWILPDAWWQGEAWPVELRLRSPLHDDGALVKSRLELEPRDREDPHGILAPTAAKLRSLRDERQAPEAASTPGRWQILGHAHLDLAWLWPVADTWQAAERTFNSVLQLMERHGELHFGHSTPALYAWLERHRPTLHRRIRAAMRQGRWEPLNGPWVECDCVLIGTASLLRQFQAGQAYSRSAFPEWSHALAWLPDSFGFSAGLPPVAAATGVRWFCTHKLAWNSDNPFPHRLFRWRGRCGSEVLAFITAPIGTDGDPVEMERYRLDWQRDTGVAEALWLPGVGDHGGGPTVEMLEQLALWDGRESALPQRHGTLRDHLCRLEPLLPSLPVWRDELYLELHRGCATSRPDQKRHNRSLERLLREAETVQALAWAARAGREDGAGRALPPPDWEPLLFHQFHDILPGTSIPEVFDQAEPLWRRARRRTRLQRDQAIGRLLSPAASGQERWTVGQWQCLPPWPRTLRLPRGPWSLLGEHGALPAQAAAAGGEWLQLPGIDGIGGLSLRRGGSGPAAPPPGGIHHPVQRTRLAGPAGEERWRLENGLVAVAVGSLGVEQLWDSRGRPQLAAPLRWGRFADRGEFWDAWDLAKDYADHPLDWSWEGPPRWLENGPLCAQVVWRGRCGESAVRLDGRLLAGSPWFELVLRIDWRQRHELLRLQVPLATIARRWAADTPGGVIERPAAAHTARERARWEVAAVSWVASVGEGPGDGLALLLDGPQGASAEADHLGVSLLRGPTWPDPGADNGPQRLRVALMPAHQGWRMAAVPDQAIRFREPLWLRPWGELGIGSTLAPFPSQEPDVQVVSLRPAPDGSAEVILAVHNLGPVRRRLRLAAPWRVLRQVDGLDQDLLDDEQMERNRLERGWSEQNGAQERISPGSSESGAANLPPWSLSFWRLGLQSSWSSKGSVRLFEGGPKA